MLTILPSFHSEEAIDISCVNSKGLSVNYRTLKEPLQSVIERCFGNAENVSPELLQKCATVSDSTINVDQETIRAWINGMFKSIESASKAFGENFSQTTTGDAAKIQLDGTRYRLQYNDGLIQIDVTVADVELDSGDKADTEIVTWILQIRDKLRTLRNWPRRAEYIHTGLNPRIAVGSSVSNPSKMREDEIGVDITWAI